MAISAERLLPAARAAGYSGSPPNFRRAAADAKKRWSRQRRVYRPWVPVPGEHLQPAHVVTPDLQERPLGLLEGVTQLLAGVTSLARELMELAPSLVTLRATGAHDRESWTDHVAALVLDTVQVARARSVTSTTSRSPFSTPRTPMSWINRSTSRRAA